MTKLGRGYVALVLLVTAGATYAVIWLEENRSRWVVEHPILDGAIGGLLIVPLAGYIALVVIDRRMERLRQAEKNKRAERLRGRLERTIRQTLIAGVFGVLIGKQSALTLDANALRHVLKEAQLRADAPSDQEVKRVVEFVVPKAARCADIAEQMAGLEDSDRLDAFATFLSEGVEFVELAVARERALPARPAEPSFFFVVCSLLQLIVNLAEESAPGALPLRRTAS